LRPENRVDITDELKGHHESTDKAPIVILQQVMSRLHRFPPLIGDSAGGSPKEWSAEVLQEEGGAAVVRVRFGQQGGKQQVTERRYVEGKNLGRKNATTPYEQAVAETQRKWRDKIEKQGYRRAEDAGAAEQGNAAEQDEGAEQGNAAERDGAAKRRRVSTLLPMLAKPFDVSKLDSKRAKTITFPCLAQPKLDGLRCLIYRADSGELVAQSRIGGRFTTVSHVLDELGSVFDAWDESARGGRLVLDGELFTFATAFEVLAGQLKRRDSTPVTEAGFHAYDMFVLGRGSERAGAESCESRLALLASLISRSPPLTHVHLVETRTCDSVDHMRTLFAEFTLAGFEGIMLRNKASPYTLGYRSPDLQKYKEFCDEEFEIVGFAEAEGRDAGTVVFICRANQPNPDTGSHETFSVRPRGSLEHRAGLLRLAPDLIAQKAKLTVIYQELSSHKVPRFPVGKDVRGGGGTTSY
jgi:DNA ligase 1